MKLAIVADTEHEKRRASDAIVICHRPRRAVLEAEAGMRSDAERVVVVVVVLLLLVVVSWSSLGRSGRYTEASVSMEASLRGVWPEKTL